MSSMTKRVEGYHGTLEWLQCLNEQGEDLHSPLALPFSYSLAQEFAEQTAELLVDAQFAAGLLGCQMLVLEDPDGSQAMATIFGSLGQLIIFMELVIYLQGHRCQRDLPR